MRQDLVAAEHRLARRLGDLGRWADARDAWQVCLDLHTELGFGGVAEIREELARATEMAGAATVSQRA